jgi:hypothetical protein
VGKTIGLGRCVVGVVWRARRLGRLVLRIRIRRGRRLDGGCKVDDSIFAHDIDSEFLTESMRNGFLS